MSASVLQERVAAVRQFNRFYTRRIGVLHERMHDSDFSLTELRVIYELAHDPEVTATILIRRLGLDAGYLSRILRRLEELGLLRRNASRQDGRQSHLTLTAKGRTAFSSLNESSNADVRQLLEGLEEAGQGQLVQAMRSIESLFAMLEPAQPVYDVRAHKPGDIGWVIHRHGVLYAQEYGWNEEFEALVAGICADFIKKFDPARERCWIVERGGERLGSVFLVKESKDVARLRLLLVEPSARGMGIGGRLINECIGFARECGYRKMVLWTNSVLVSARRLYEAAGFKLTREEQHHSFGHDLVTQDWELALERPRS